MVENPRYLTPKADSNDWLKPIGESAKAIFSRFSRGKAIEIAGAFVKGLYIVENNEIPWTIVFSSDNFESVLERLKAVLRTPDGDTPTTNPKYSDSIKGLRKILFDAGAAEHPYLGHAASSLIRVAAGETIDHSWYFYDDLSRRYPHCVGDWEEKLVEQFGAKAVSQVIENKNELLDLLRQNKAIALQHNQTSFRMEGEDTAAYIKRALTSLSITDIESMKTAAKLLNTRLNDYRNVAYRLRSIPPFVGK